MLGTVEGTEGERQRWMVAARKYEDLLIHEHRRLSKMMGRRWLRRLPGGRRRTSHQSGYGVGGDHGGYGGGTGYSVGGSF
jgi:hypothetical protein